MVFVSCSYTSSLWEKTTIIYFYFTDVNHHSFSKQLIERRGSSTVRVFWGFSVLSSAGHFDPAGIWTQTLSWKHTPTSPALKRRLLPNCFRVCCHGASSWQLMHNLKEQNNSTRRPNTVLDFSVQTCTVDVRRLKDDFCSCSCRDKNLLFCKDGLHVLLIFAVVLVVTLYIWYISIYICCVHADPSSHTPVMSKLQWHHSAARSSLYTSCSDFTKRRTKLLSLYKYSSSQTWNCCTLMCFLIRRIGWIQLKSGDFIPDPFQIKCCSWCLIMNKIKWEPQHCSSWTTCAVLFSFAFIFVHLWHFKSSFNLLIGVEKKKYFLCINKSRAWVKLLKRLFLVQTVYFLFDM